ncbi:TonB-dependent receptor domain-containing protein [Formosa sp. S-31]|uniref:TonB-dependent receptor domain-containing protein n=1 Tax=Formosa sp. S-31 TaxID=2790949 RepID=UPI003EB95397
MHQKLALLFFFSCLCCFSQDIKLTGRVTDANNIPIEFANVILTPVDNQEVLKGTTTNQDGYFSIEGISAEAYQFNISFIGFETYKKELALKQNLDLGTLTLKVLNEELATVDVIAKAPTFKKQPDRIIFNIEQTSLTEGSLMDVLKSTPGVLIMNDEISVKNASNIIYLINDKRVYLSGEDIQQLLSGTSANYVQEVEVITNPPAKYDAEGAAVINIKMSKTFVAGYHGSVFGNYTQGIYPRYHAGMSHFYKTKNLNIFANYAYNQDKINRYNSGTVIFLENGVKTGQWDNDIDRDTKSKTHTANVNIDYDLNETSLLSFSANANITPYWKRNTYMDTQAVDSAFTSLNKTDDSTTNLAFNLDYVNQSESGNRLAINLHHTNYDYDRMQDIDSRYFDADQQFLRDHAYHAMAAQKTYIYSGQLDYSLPLETMSLEMGAKVSFIDSNSDVVQIVDGFYPTVDVTNTGLFDYTELNYAGYISASKSWDSWQLSAGLRGEYTDAEGDLSNPVTKNTFNYFKLFPTVNIAHDFNENHSLGLSYGKRIQRPTYSALNPFKFYFNDYTYLQGNPNLQPTISHLITLSYTLKQTYTFEVYYRYENDPVSELVFQENNANQLIYMPVNLDKSVDYGFDFMTYKPFTNVWSVYVINSIFHETAYFKALQSGNSIETNKTWAMYTNVMNFFTFLEDQSLTGEISLLYMSPMINGSADVSSRTQVDLGLKKSFNDGKWVASIKASDIFRTTDFTEKNKYLNQDNTYYSRFDNQWIRVGLRYNFGNTKLSVAQKEEKERKERNRLKGESAGN